MSYLPVCVIHRFSFYSVCVFSTNTKPTRRQQLIVLFQSLYTPTTKTSVQKSQLKPIINSVSGQTQGTHTPVTPSAAGGISV